MLCRVAAKEDQELIEIPDSEDADAVTPPVLNTHIKWVWYSDMVGHTGDKLGRVPPPHGGASLGRVQLACMVAVDARGRML